MQPMRSAGNPFRRGAPGSALGGGLLRSTPTLGVGYRGPGHALNGAVL